MYKCDICSAELTDNGVHKIPAEEFKKLIQNGLNPFAEDIRLPTGLHLSELGSAAGLSVNEQYQGWKSRALADHTDWGLCDHCRFVTMKYASKSSLTRQSSGEISKSSSQPPARATESSQSQAPTTVQAPAPSRLLPRWGVILAWGALFALLIIVAVSLMQKQQGPVAVGQPAPDFTLTTFDNEQITYESLKGKVIVLNFWASWCKPCEQEAADLESAWRYYQPQGDVIFIGVDYVDTETAARKYLEKFDITYPNGPDLGTRISQAYRITGVPETYIIDKNGNLAYIKLSPFLSEAEIHAAIDPLLKP